VRAVGGIELKELHIVQPACERGVWREAGGLRT
jgi:hypothetical protein